MKRKHDEWLKHEEEQLKEINRKKEEEAKKVAGSAH